MQRATIPTKRILEAVINLGVGYISYFFLTITILGLALPSVFAIIDPATGGLPALIQATLLFLNINVAGHYSFNLVDIFNVIGFLSLLLWGLGAFIRLIIKNITDRHLNSNDWIAFLIGNALIFGLVILALINLKTAPFVDPGQRDATRTMIVIGSIIAYISFCMRTLALALGRKITNKIKPLN